VNSGKLYSWWCLLIFKFSFCRFSLKLVDPMLVVSNKLYFPINILWVNKNDLYEVSHWICGKPRWITKGQNKHEFSILWFTKLIQFQAGTKMNYVIIQNCNNASCIGMKNGYALSHEYMLSGNNHTVHNCTCMWNEWLMTDQPQMKNNQNSMVASHQSLPFHIESVVNQRLAKLWYLCSVHHANAIALI